MIVAFANCPVESATTYFAGVVTVPLKDGSGSKVTVPLALAVYVPSLATVSESKVQLVVGVEVVAHNFTEEGVNVAPAPAASFVRTVIVWFVSYAPVDVSFTAVGAGGTTGVRVDVAF